MHTARISVRLGGGRVRGSGAEPRKVYRHKIPIEGFRIGPSPLWPTAGIHRVIPFSENEIVNSNGWFIVVGFAKRPNLQAFLDK